MVAGGPQRQWFTVVESRIAANVNTREGGESQEATRLRQFLKLEISRLKKVMELVHTQVS
jgi:hypothetical protein